jgi:hypothetical protein
LCDEQIGEQLHLVAGDGGNRNNVGELSELADRHQLGGHARSAYGVDLRNDGDNGRRDRGELSRDVAITGTDALVSRHAEPDDIDIAQRRANDIVEPFAEQGARPVQSGRVDDDELGVRSVDDSPNRPPGRLRLVARDSDLRADEGVRERGLAGVRPADETTKSRAERALRRGLGCHLGILPLFVHRFLDSFQNRAASEGSPVK